METKIVNQSQTEIMHLKATIVVLREQLEALSFDKDKAVQRQFYFLLMKSNN